MEMSKNVNNDVSKDPPISPCKKVSVAIQKYQNRFLTDHWKCWILLSCGKFQILISFSPSLLSLLSFIYFLILSRHDRENTNYIYKYSLRTERVEAIITLTLSHQGRTTTSRAHTVEWTWQLTSRDCGYYGVVLQTTKNCTHPKLMFMKTS